MDEIRFEWNRRKDEVNRGKHGVSFEEAKTVFYDENAVLADDAGHSESEERFILLGVSSRMRIVVVCHCYRENGESVIRIISARKATANEAKYYEEQIK